MLRDLLRGEYGRPLYVGYIHTVATCPLLHTELYTDRVGLLSLLLHGGHDGFSVLLLIVVFRLIFSPLFSSSSIESFCLRLQISREYCGAR